MNTLKALGSGLGLAALSLASTIAQAEVAGNISIASEYVFRGQPSSGNGAQVSGGLDWSGDRFYAGGWLSNVGNNYTGNEVDVYFGANFDKLDVGYMAYLYPGSTLPGQGFSDTNASEFYVGYNFDRVSLYAWYGVGNDWGEDMDDYVYVEGNLSGPMNDQVDVSLHAGVWIGTGSAVNHPAVATYPAPATGPMVDSALDVALSLGMGGFSVSVSSLIFDGPDAGIYKAPRFNVGYTWTFENLPIMSRF